MFKNLQNNERLNLSKKILSSFVSGGVQRKPLLASDWEFVKKDFNIYIYSKSLDIEIKKISFNRYVMDYLYNFNIDNNQLKGSYYYTSIGFISEEDYFIAEDIYEQFNKRVPKKELRVNSIYLSDKGEEMVFIGKIHYKSIYRKGDFLKKEFHQSKDDYFYLNELPRGKPTGFLVL